MVLTSRTGFSRRGIASSASTISSPAIPGNIEHLAGNERYRFIKQDVSNFIFLPDDVDYVFHFASPASPIDYLEINPDPDFESRLARACTTCARAAPRAKEATLLLASTSECYGDPLVHPQREDYWGNVNPIGPRGVYDEAKRFAEAMTMAYHRYHHVDTKIVRIFNTYGPRMRLRDGRVVPAFIGQALRGEPLTIFGDGSQTRSFCNCSDLIDGIFKLSQSDFHEPVNIGNPREMTIKQFAEEIIRITGTSSSIEYRPLPVDDPKVRQPDIARAKKVLNWEPRVDFDEGIRKTIDYFRTRPELKFATISATFSFPTPRKSETRAAASADANILRNPSHENSFAFHSLLRRPRFRDPGAGPSPGRPWFGKAPQAATSSRLVAGIPNHEWSTKAL